MLTRLCKLKHLKDWTASCRRYFLYGAAMRSYTNILHETVQHLNFLFRTDYVTCAYIKKSTFFRENFMQKLKSDAS